MLAGRDAQSEAGVDKVISLSPIDPLRYAHLATRAFGCIVRGDLEVACDWAERGARAPNAHVHIFVIAAMANDLAGRRAAAESWATEVKRRMSTYRQEMFFKSFPFREDGAREAMRKALASLGI